MRRYLLIAAAIVIAYLVYQAILWYVRRRSTEEGAARGASWAPLASIAVGVLVLILGLIFLESGAGTPADSYRPAQLIDGQIQPGNFSDQADK